MRFCLACGREGEEGKVYCKHCGAILGPDKNAKSASTPYTGTRLGKPPTRAIGSVKNHSPSFFFKTLRSIVFLAPIAALVLCLTPPEIAGDLAANIPYPRVAMQRFLAYSKSGPVAVSQELINAYLKVTPHSLWKPPFDFLPAPEWKSARVVLQQKQGTYSLELAVFGYSLYFSETFVIAGAPQRWLLESEYGSIGRLPVPKYFLSYLAPLFSANSPRVEE